MQRRPLDAQERKVGRTVSNRVKRERERLRRTLEESIIIRDLSE